jgi:signal recognition particle receptor subunit beta
MAVFNLRRKEINAKIVYYGPGLSGKTTNLQYIHQKLKPEHKGNLMTLATQTDRTLFFDFLPVEVGEVRGLKTRFQLYTVPGQVFYNATRKLVLKNVDGVVFVADSRREGLTDSLDSLRNLEENLNAHNISIHDIPVILQYNKRDMPTALSREELDRHLNPHGWPVFEAVAHKGTGVLESLTAICKLVIRTLKDKDPQNFGRESLGDSTADRGAAMAAELGAELAPAPDDFGDVSADLEAEQAAVVVTDEADEQTEDLDEVEAIEDIETLPDDDHDDQWLGGEPDEADDAEAILLPDDEAGAWALAQPKPPTWTDGQLTVPLRFERGAETISFNLKIRLELPDK